MLPGHMLFVAHWDWVIANFRLPIADGLRAAGTKVTVVCPEGEHTPRIRNAGYEVVPWPSMERRSMRPDREIRALRELTSLYRRLRPDAVQHFTVKPNLYGTLAARRVGVPRVYNLFSGLGYLFSPALPARIARTTLRPVMQRAFTAPNVWMLTQNPEDRAALLEASLAVEERARVMPNGVDTERFSPPDDPRPDRVPPTVLLAARLLRDKGVLELVAAARRLNRDGPTIRVWIAGEPDVGNPASLNDAELEELRRVPGVEILGPRSDMPELMHQVDIAALPSRYKEGMPRFLLEAMASGLPVVASDIPGSRELIDDGDCGMLVPVGDVEGLGAALALLAQDPERRRRMGGVARQRVVERHSDEVVQREYLDLYRG